MSFAPDGEGSARNEKAGAEKTPRGLKISNVNPLSRASAATRQKLEFLTCASETLEDATQTAVLGSKECLRGSDWGAKATYMVLWRVNPDQ